MKILVTTGPTQEYIDPVRFLSNAASGRFGVEIARSAAQRGHQVTLIHGPIDMGTFGPLLGPGIERVGIISSEALREAIEARYAATDVVFMVAAVADFTPVHYQPHKIKKQPETEQHFTFRPTQDILKGLGAVKKHQILVGFNLETRGGEEEARRKLVAKNLDLIVLNGPENLGAVEATVKVLAEDRTVASWTQVAKAEIAAHLLEIVEAWPRT